MVQPGPARLASVYGRRRSAGVVRPQNAVMATFDRAIRWYQVKIGTHDSPTWEPSVEERSLRSIHDIPKKATTFKSQLIDVDLVDGSTFFKSKPSHAWPAHAWKGFVRLLCLPAYFSWWRQHTSFGFAVSLLLMYACQLAAIGVVFYRVDSSSSGGAATAGPSMSEVINPLLMMMVLSVIHTQIVFTQSSHHSYTSKKARLLEKKKQQQNVAVATSTGLTASTVGASSLGTSTVLSPKDKRWRASFVQTASATASTASQSAVTPAKSGAMSRLLLLPTSAATASTLGYNGLIPGSPSVSATATSCNASTDSSDEAYVEDVKYATVPPTAAAAATLDHNISVATVTPSETLADLRPTLDASAASLPIAELSYQSRFPHSGSCVPPDSTMESAGDSQLLPTVYSSAISASGSSGCRPSASISWSCDEVEAHEQLHADLQQIVGSPSNASSGWGLHLPAVPRPTVRSTRYGSQLRRPRQLRQPPAIVTAAPVDPFSLNACAPAKGDNDRVAAERVPLDAPRVICESTATSDGDTPSSSLLKWGSEWEGNRMHSSDVNSTDSSSECSVDIDGAGGIISGSGCPSGALNEDAASTTGGGGAMRRRRRRILMQTSSVAFAAASAVGATELPPSAAASVVYIPSAYDRISCIIWEDDVCKKADLSVIDMGAIIEQKVEQIRPSYDYVLLAVLFVLLFSITPFMYRIYHSPASVAALVSAAGDWTALTLTASNWTEGMQRLVTLTSGLRCEGLGLCFVMANSAVQRVYLSALIMFLLAVAERTYWHRLLYAKHFSYLTSSRRSRKYDVPHFRLNKVKSIKTWLSLRSFLKRRGLQRSVDVIVSATFVLLICLLAVMCAQLLRDHEAFLTVFANWELTVLCLILGVFLLRYYGLGTKINKKYRNLSILITEEINLYLQMEQKPHKKDDLMVANSVLKLAVDLIKEVESPFKMSNFNINPVVFNVTKLIMLSAFSAVLTELFGFKLKLHSVKLT